MEDILFSLNPWWEGREIDTGIERSQYVEMIFKSLKKRNLVFLYGLRRVGKTTIMRQVIKKLPDPKKALYVSMDAYGLWDHSLKEILDFFRRLHKISRKERVFLFVDEVSHRKGFEAELKWIVDHENVSIVAASSSSLKMMMKSPMITGRYYPIEVLPLSFREFLEFRGVEDLTDYAMLEGYFDEYMEIGGMPEYVITKDPLIPKTIVDDIIYKDIMSEFSASPEKIEELFMLIAERIGKKTSYSKLSRLTGISKSSISTYIYYLKKSLLVYEIPICGKLNVRLKSPKKLYIADHGLRNVFTGMRDKGAIFENIVFMLLKSKNPCYPADLDIDFKVGGKLIDAKYRSRIKESQKIKGAVEITERDIILHATGKSIGI